MGLILWMAAAAASLALPAPAQEPDTRAAFRAFLQNQAAEQLAARRQAVEAIYSPAGVQGRKQYVRAQILKMIGGLPLERSPLALRRTGTLERDGYRVEKIIYESQPKFYVTANLYVPTTGAAPYPAVLQPLGHSLTAKARIFYQSLSIGLVKHGFVVLTFDPIGQGERRIFYDPDLEDSKVGGTTVEHQMVGVQSLLAGESLARYRIWDAIRSIDLLESMPEVDAKRIGVAGCSGGGTLTAYVAALDDRVQAAAPACYITAWEEQLAQTGPQDAEQQFPDQLLAGLNHGDFAIAFAPKPYLILSTTDDFFPLEGARKTFEEGKRIYSLFGSEEKIGWFTAPGPHGMPRSSREAIYTWMKRWLKGQPDHAAEPDFQIEHDEDLNATPTGQVSTSLGGETASTLNRKRFAGLTPNRPALGGAHDLERHKAAVRERVLALTRYRKSTGILRVESRGESQAEGYRLERLVYQTEPGRLVPALLAAPDAARSNRRAVVYVDEQGVKPEGDVEELARAGYTVLAIDTAGRGESSPRWGSYSDPWFGQDKATWLALMIGRPLTGLRMDDISRGLDLLAERGLLPQSGAAGVGKGTAAVELLHAAALEDRLNAVVLEGSLLSYESIAAAPVHRRVFDTVVPGVLGRYDLADLAAAVAPRPLWLINPRSPAGKSVTRDQMRNAYRYTADAFAAAGAADRFRIGLRREQESFQSAYPEF